MATENVNIIPSRYAEATQTAQYTSTNAKTIVDKFTATNVSASNVKLSINLVPPGASVGNDNLVIDERTIAPGETYACPEVVGQVIEDKGFISTLAGAASAITINASGRVIS